MTTIGEMVPEIEKELNSARDRRWEVETLKAMLDAAMTLKVVDEIAKTSYMAGLRDEMYRHVGTTRARLNGRISNTKARDERVLYPSVYHHPQTRHRYLVSNGKTVQGKLTVPTIEQQGYRYARTIK